MSAVLNGRPVRLFHVVLAIERRQPGKFLDFFQMLPTGADQVRMAVEALDHLSVEPAL